MRSLVDEVAARVRPEYKEKCLAIVRGHRLDTFSQGYQDWLLFHNYFSDYAYGTGFYLDFGSNDPVFSSNTFFFDACLGWKGICVEPNPYHHNRTLQERTCTLVPHCIAKLAGAYMDFDQDQEARVFPVDGSNLTRVTCMTLEGVLQDHNITRADFASMDVEGDELSVMQCSSFDNFDIPIWVVETNKAGAVHDQTFMQAGYAKVRNLLERSQGVLGTPLDSLYVRHQRAFVQGPAFLRGGNIMGSCGPRRYDCMERVPYVLEGEVGHCDYPRHPWSKMGGGPGVG